jgi:hypothetical protein
VIPATGWLTHENNQGALPAGGLLPKEFVGHYFEGGDGVIIGATELDFLQVAVLFVTSFIRERFGYGKSATSENFVPILTIDLVQPEVFGVLLLDSFTPPAIAAEFFEFPAYTQGACMGGVPGTPGEFGTCLVSTPVDVVEAEPVTPAFTEP